jgi:hypothetical protein
MGRHARLFINDVLVAEAEDSKSPNEPLEFRGEFVLDVDKFPDKEKFRLRLELKRKSVKRGFKFKFWKGFINGRTHA